MNNQQTDIFPPGIGAFELDEDAREIYITDGFLNKRVPVYDLDNGIQTGVGRPRHAAEEITNEPTPPYTGRAARRPTRRTSPPPCTAFTSRGTSWSTSASGA